MKTPLPGFDFSSSTWRRLITVIQVARLLYLLVDLTYRVGGPKSGHSRHLRRCKLCRSWIPCTKKSCLSRNRRAISEVRSLDASGLLIRDLV